MDGLADTLHWAFTCFAVMHEAHAFEKRTLGAVQELDQGVWDFRRMWTKELTRAPALSIKFK